MKFTNPKGTRDFNAEQVFKRTYIFDTIKDVFIRYGFQPIETPAMENLTTLTGKYGEEGDKLLFKILRNGNFLDGVKPEWVEQGDTNQALAKLSNKGLRYDLTVPFARFVTQHQHTLQFPFKRYQMQPVWRADRPQKGRYQEFYQCDADVVGSDSLMYEAELVQIYDQVFARLGIPVAIKMNNRKILNGIAMAAGVDDFTAMTVGIDKLDKIGREGVEQELEGRGFSTDTISFIFQALEADLEQLREMLKEQPIGLEGIEEYQQVLSFLEGYPLKNELSLDLTLARGLNYYTGCIFEVQALDVKMGSIGGGGRYANLTETFGMKNMPGVGISFGAERIYDVLEECQLFPDDIRQAVKLLLVSMDEKAHRYAFKQIASLRAAGIACELYPEPTKMQKQMKYANNRKIPFVGIIGEEEQKSGKIALKNMASGEQSLLSVAEIIEKLA